MKNVILLRNYYLSDELEAEISCFVDYYNSQRYHESLENLTPADGYFGRAKQIEDERQRIKKKTLQRRKMENLNGKKINWLFNT